MSKRRYEALVPEHFKELLRSALQNPKVPEQPDEARRVPTELLSRQSDPCAASVVSSSSHVSAGKPPPPPPPPLPLPKIPSVSFYSAKVTPSTPPHGDAAAAVTPSPLHGTPGTQTAPAEPAYLRLIQLYKKRCSLFGAERRQHCFQLFAKLKEALQFASQQSNCRVFAQEGAYCPFTFATLFDCPCFFCLTRRSERPWLPPVPRLQGFQPRNAISLHIFFSRLYFIS
jgi:hypothetical protein